jgi:hypothetical protein
MLRGPSATAKVTPPGLWMWDEEAKPCGRRRRAAGPPAAAPGSIGREPRRAENPMPDPATTEHSEDASPEIQARIRASFERQGLMRHLGAQLAHVGPGRVDIVLPHRPELTQQHGYFHAGVTTAIADSAGGGVHRLP